MAANSRECSPTPNIGKRASPKDVPDSPTVAQAVSLSEQISKGAYCSVLQQPSFEEANDKESCPPVDVENSLVKLKGACKAISDYIKHLSSLGVIASAMWSNVERAMLVLDQNEIIVGVFGEHNCGKSTFINTLLGHEFLPMNMFNCTALSVEIQHSDEICNVCYDSCGHQNKQCPQLMVKNHTVVMIIGRQAINSHLTELNEKFRSMKQTTESPTNFEVPKLILKAYIPFLNEGIPPGWTVKLVDNPGYGDANEYMIQLADTSAVATSAYVYLMQTEQIEGQAAASFFKQIQETDAVSDCRCVIGITKFDTICHVGRTESSDLEKSVKHKVVSTIESAVGIKISEKMVVPIRASKLLQILSADDKQSHTPSLCSDESPKEVKLQKEVACGIADIKLRIHRILGKDCLKTWAQKLHSQFLVFCKDGQQEVTNEISKLCSEWPKQVLLLNDIDKLRARLEELSEQRSDSGTTSWEKLERSYYQDLKDTEAPRIAASLIDHLIDKFKAKCQQKCKQGELAPEEFKMYVKQLMNESRSELQKVFGNFRFNHVDKCFAILNQEVIKHVAHLEELARRLTGQLNAFNSTMVSGGLSEEDARPDVSVQADSLFPKEAESQILRATSVFAPDIVPKDSSNEIPYCNLNLGTEDSLKVKRRLLSNSANSSSGSDSDGDDESDEHKVLVEQATCLDDLTSTGEVPKIFSWKNALKEFWDHVKKTAKKLISTTSTSTEAVSPQHSHDSGDSNRQTNKMGKDGDGGLIAGSTPSVPGVEGNTMLTESGSSTAISTPEVCIGTESDDTDREDIEDSIPIPTELHATAEDDDEVSSSVESGIFADNWSDEVLLISAIDTIHKLMKEECDQYLWRIAPSAVMSFHRKYQSKIKASLAKVDEDFKVVLDESREESDKLKTRMASLLEHDKCLNELQDNLAEAWMVVSSSLDGVSVKEKHPRLASRIKKLAVVAKTVVKNSIRGRSTRQELEAKVMEQVLNSNNDFDAL